LGAAAVGELRAITGPDHLPPGAVLTVLQPDLLAQLGR
jgi:hypothetical protein